tara:strand:+ start:7841 stop:9124 length:1284 start_codon:yes stop_codon:yes gene_type:complete
MKKLFIIVLLLITAGLIAPKFIGSVVETEHQLVIDKLNSNPAITINSSTFTANWFGGTAITEMTILLQDDGIEDITLIVEENLSFGPVIFTDEGLEFALSYSQADINFKDLVLDEEIETFINNKIHLSGLLTFSKNIVSNIVIDEVSKEIDGNKIASTKAVGNFTLEDNNKIYGDFNWAGLTITTSDEGFTLGKVQFSVDQTLIAGDYYQGNAISTGDFDFSIASAAAKDATSNTVFTLDKLLIKAVAAVSNDLMTITMKYSADKVESAGQKLENANLDVVFTGLNINVMEEVNTLMTKLSADGEAMFSPENMQKISALTAKLLVDNPVVEIKDFSVQTPEGKIESSMQVSVDKKLFDTTNIMSIMAAVKANANGKAPMSFFAKLGLAPMVELYVKQGFIIQKENELSVNLNYIQGKLEVNGNIIAL